MVSDLNIFVWKWSKIATTKNVDFALQNMVETTLPDGDLWLKGTRLQVLLAMARNLSIGKRCIKDSEDEKSAKKGLKTV